MSIVAVILIVFAVVGSMTFLVIDTNKRKLLSQKSEEPEKWVYDGSPLLKCYRCGGQAVIVGEKKPNDNPLWLIRCKDCGNCGNSKIYDLGLAMRVWNDQQDRPYHTLDEVKPKYDMIYAKKIKKETNT